MLVPAATDLVGDPKADPTTRDSVLSLIAVVDDPPASDAIPAAAWSALVAKLDPKATRTLHDRRTAAARQRTMPPPALKKQDFCLAREVAEP